LTVATKRPEDRAEAPVESVHVAAYKVPGEARESDGTLQWDSMTMILVEVTAGGTTGLGYTYSERSAAVLVADKLAGVLVGRSALATRDCWYALVHATRNLGLFVDANGAYDRKRALHFAQVFAGYDVSWFEDPVSSNDLEGMRMIRDQGPPGMEITTGEYGYDTIYFRRLAEAGAADVMQADATRCAGFTGFLLADAVADAFELPLSSHTAPSAHLHCCCAALQIRHMEWFHDHVRIEHMLFDGAPEPKHGRLSPDFSRPGIGVSLKRADAEPYRI
jgi:L-alanine-DL-glutamate epimerase-like enolase superfamily enzyme